MSMKIRRGIALLLVALVALLIGLVSAGSGAPSAVEQITGLVVLLAGVGGLVLLTWGLLSPERRVDG